MNPIRDEEGRLRLQALLAHEYGVREHSGEKAEALRETATLMECDTAEATELTRERLKQAIEALSGNQNTVIYDHFGLPSVMVRIPRLTEDDLTANGSSAPCPAFCGVSGDILVGKYQSSLLDGVACSLPLARPVFGVSYDEALQCCGQKGDGWHMTPFALRMAIALWCRKKGFLPHGNNCGGQDYFCPQEKGTLIENGQTLCGSGPLTWSHDGTPNGIYDLNGNLNEWDSGFRLMNGEIQLIPMAKLLTANADLGLESPLWRALDANGELVAPGTPGTLKYDAPDGQIRLGREVRSPGIGNSAFRDIQAEPGLEPPLMTRLLGLYPESDREGYGLGWRWITTYGEATPLCGGANRADDHAGVFFVGATYPRTKNYNLTGFRLIYIDREGTK